MKPYFSSSPVQLSLSSYTKVPDSLCPSSIEDWSVDSHNFLNDASTSVVSPSNGKAVRASYAWVAVAKNIIMWELVFTPALVDLSALSLETAVPDSPTAGDMVLSSSLFAPTVPEIPFPMEISLPNTHAFREIFEILCPACLDCI